MISCLQACKEGLDINSLESLGQGIKVRKEPASPPTRFMSRRLPRASALWECSPLLPSGTEPASGKGAATGGRLVTVTLNGHLLPSPEIPRERLCGRIVRLTVSVYLDGLGMFHRLAGWLVISPKGAEAVCREILLKIKSRDHMWCTLGRKVRPGGLESSCGGRWVFIVELRHRLSLEQSLAIKGDVCTLGILIRCVNTNM